MGFSEYLNLKHGLDTGLITDFQVNGINVARIRHCGDYCMSVLQRHRSKDGRSNRGVHGEY
jgi:hypothetical protein